MVFPEGKRCPITQGEKPCLGSLCAWFDEDAKMCGVLTKTDRPARSIPNPKTPAKAKAAPAK